MRVYFSDMQVVVDSASLFMDPPNQDVLEWTNTVARELKAKAVLYCPPNRRNLRVGSYQGRTSSGALRNSISTFVYNYGDVHVLSIDLSADTDYALFVHEGTAFQGQRYIYSNKGFAQKAAIDRAYQRGEKLGKGFKGLRMGPLPALGPYSNYQLRVHGQKANPFLTDAYTAVRRVHTGLPAKRFAHTFIA
jgi:hypothetical protein